VKKLTIALIVVIALLSIAAVKTVIPDANVSKVCLLGYKAACSFTPISAVILALGAAVTFVVAKRTVLGKL
jgi:hypothetical protein